MPPRRLALIVIITVVILIIAVFLWLIIGLILKEEIAPAETGEAGVLPTVSKDELIINSLKQKDTLFRPDSLEKNQIIINNLGIKNNKNSDSDSAENNSEGKSALILEALRAKDK